MDVPSRDDTTTGDTTNTTSGPYVPTTEAERVAIRDYKEVDSALPDGLDGRELAIPEDTDGDELDSLGKWLSEAKPFVDVLVRAANLRETFTQEYILGHGFAEEPGHKFWRENMNALAEDAQRKLAHYTAEYERLYSEKTYHLQEYVENVRFDRTRTSFPYTSYDKEVRTRPVKKVKPPRPSDTELRRRRQELRDQLRAKREALHAENRAVDDAIEQLGPYHRELASFEKDKKVNAQEISAEWVYRLLLSNGFDEPRTCRQFTLGVKTGVIIVGSEEEKRKLALLISDALEAVSCEFCDYYGCRAAAGNPYSHVHKCNAGGSGSIVPAALSASCGRLEAILSLIGFISQIGDYIEIGNSVIQTSLLLSNRIPWDSYVISEIMIMLVSGMNDISFIANHQIMCAKLQEQREFARLVMCELQSGDAANAANAANTHEDLIATLNIINAYCTRCAQYIDLFIRMFPGALYADRYKSMKRYIQQGTVLYGSLVTIDGRRYVDPPNINYDLIRRKIGLKIRKPPADSHIMKLYHETLREFDRILRAEHARLGGKKSGKK